MDKRTFLKNTSLFLTAAVLSSFSSPSVEVAIKGHLKSKTHRNVGKVTVLVKGALQNGLGTTITDKNGNFNLGFDVGEEVKPLSFYYVNQNKDTILLMRTAKLKSDSPEMTFWIK